MELRLITLALLIGATMYAAILIGDVGARILAAPIVHATAAFAH